jgi:hypothetical protein
MTAREDLDAVLAARLAKPKRKNKIMQFADGYTVPAPLPRGNPHMVANDELNPGVKHGDAGRNPTGIGGPGRGRQPGSRTKYAILAERIAEEAGPEIMKMLVELAVSKKNLGAAKLVLEFGVPRGKLRGVRFQLPIPTDASLEQLAEASSALLEAVARGDCSAAEAQEIAKVLEAHAEILRSGELERELKVVEEEKR